MLYDALMPILAKAVKDKAFGAKLLGDPNGTIRGAGVDIGQADVKLDWVESTNILNIHVKNGGADWNGGIFLQLEK